MPAMKKVYFIFLFSIFANLLFAQDENGLIKAVKTKLNKVADYQANGRMSVDVSFINAPASNVMVYYKKPDQFKINKEGGISILPKGGVSVNINSLLTGDDYAVVPAGSAIIKGITTKVIKLLPLAETSDVVLTTLYIDEKSLLIRKATVTTKESGSYEMELDFGRYAAWGLPDKVVFLFNTKDYKLPKGLTFEYENGNTKKEKTIKNKKGRVEVIYTNYIINKGISDKVFAEK
jgi:outer membrane lipoprotein-sorting protein